MMKKTIVQKIISTGIFISMFSASMSFSSLAVEDSSVKKNFDYYCKLSDDEVYSEYVEFYSNPELLNQYGYIRDDRYSEYSGIDLYEHIKYDLEYGWLSTSGFKINIPLSYDSIKQQDVYNSSYLGFGDDIDYTALRAIGSVSDFSVVDEDTGEIQTPMNIDIMGEDFNNFSVYTFMRWELTLYNSQFFEDNNLTGRALGYTFNTKGKEAETGDANIDGKVSIADSIKILQYLANPDRYPMGELAKSLAECDGVGGITGMDAFTIQLTLDDF